MIEHLSHCIYSFIGNAYQISLAAAALSVAVAAIFAMRMKSTSVRMKMQLVYLHMAALFFTPIFFALSMKCNGVCDMALVELAAYSIPSAFAASLAFGFFGIPQLYLKFSGAKKVPAKSSIFKFAAKHAAKIMIPAPAIFFSDSQAPYAFSSSWPKPMIVLSVGLSDILEKKEIEAVLLHELHHTRSQASVVKLSAFLLRFSPFSALKKFNDELDSEERAADAFAAKTQGTSRYLNSAKRKVSGF